MAKAKIDEEERDGNLVRVKEPAFLTLVAKPANTTGFKIVRSANAQQESSMKPIIRRTRRSDAQPVLALTFPDGFTEEQVQETLERYGMSGYKVSNEKGIYRALRGDLQSIANTGTQDIKLTEDGIVATVTEPSIERSDTEKSCISVASLEFSADKFTEDSIITWWKNNSVDSKAPDIDNSGQHYVVRRNSVSDNEETRRMEVDDGVTAVVVRADSTDIPFAEIQSIKETAYGSWGWGQLDFSATLADKAFSAQGMEAIETLHNVLHHIMYYSELPLDVRKVLVGNALSQFGTYVGSILDSLPRQLLASVARSAQLNTDNHMTTAKEGGATNQAAQTKPVTIPEVEVKKVDVAPGTPPEPPAANVSIPDNKPENAAASENKPLTRAEAQTLFADSIAAALAAAGIKAPEPAQSESVSINRADVTTAMTEVLAPLVQRLEKLEGTAVVRSAAADPVMKSVAPTEKTVDGKGDANIFRGALGSLIGGRKSE